MAFISFGSASYHFLRNEIAMKACAIDIHHHYVPTSLLEEAKKSGKHLGVELVEKDGHQSLSFAGGPPFVLHPELPAVDERLKMMADSELAVAALGLIRSRGHLRKR